MRSCNILHFYLFFKRLTKLILGVMLFIFSRSNVMISQVFYFSNKIYTKTWWLWYFSGCKKFSNRCWCFIFSRWCCWIFQNEATLFQMGAVKMLDFYFGCDIFSLKCTKFGWNLSFLSVFWLKIAVFWLFSALFPFFSWYKRVLWPL